MTGSEARAIVWAQWRSIANYHARSGTRRFALPALFAIIWYGFWMFVAVSIGIMISEPGNIALLRSAGPTALLLQFVYWQIVPIMMVSTGVSLDLSRLMVYPVPHAHLFTIEVLLRVTTCAEMLLLSAGMAAGIVANPELPSAGALAIPVFAAFNLFVSAGLKDLLGRLMAKKDFREGMVFLLVLLAGLPQLVLVAGAPTESSIWFKHVVSSVLPWGATATITFGPVSFAAIASLLIWTAVAGFFGRNQFERTLHFDVLEARSSGRNDHGRRRILDLAAAIVSKPFRDPFAALLEKEIRLLSRSARFRLLFLMGFSFGLLIWLPMAGRRDADSFLRSNYLTVVSAYALMLLGEVCFWNNLGLDRGAVQAYFTLPGSFSTVLRSKNTAAAFFIALEIMMVASICGLLGMPVTALSVTETFCATAVFAMFLMSLGNMLSVRYARPVDPAQSWKTGSMGRAQAYLLFLYPVAAAPVGLAYGARFAFDSTFAFFGVLLIDFAIACVFYAISLESAVKTAVANKEAIVLALSKAEGPAGS